MTFSPAQLLKRRESIGASDANYIMGGNDERLMQLWLEKTGQAEPEDLSRSLPVQMGVWTEPLNRRWYTLTTGEEIERAGESVKHAAQTFMTCTLDGFIASRPAVFEAKHVNPFSEIDGVVQRYMPQLHHQMHVCGVSEAILSVFVGTQRHEVYSVALDEFYLAALIEREEAFWQAVQTKTPPVALPVIAPPVPPEAMRSVDMTGSNEWASLAADWLENKKAASTFEKAAKGVKALMQPDMGEAYGHGLRCVRAKNGNLSVKESK